MFLASVQIAGPLLVVLFLADVGLGLLTRVAPALNAFAMGFPLKILLTVTLAAVMFVALPRIVVLAHRAGHDGSWGWADGGFRSEEKTEQATQKRMQEVRSKGELPSPRTSPPGSASGPPRIMLPATIGAGADAGTDQMFASRHVAAHPDLGARAAAARDGLGSVLATLLPFLIVIAMAVLAGAAAQGGVQFKQVHAASTNSSTCVTGIRRVFGTHALWEGAKALLKTAVVGIVLYVVIQGMMPVLLVAGGLPVSALLDAAGEGAASLLRSAVVAGLAAGRGRRLRRDAPQPEEDPDDQKGSQGREQEHRGRPADQVAAPLPAAGDEPQPDDRRRRRRRRGAGQPDPRRGRAEVRAGQVRAPRRRQGRRPRSRRASGSRRPTDGVPMVKDIPLARALHAACELGQEIPVDLYNAVARVLAFVMALKARGTASGVHSMTERHHGLRRALT